jgi:hypothetical protein
VLDRDGAWCGILCVAEERVVGNDNTVAWAARRLQLPESRLRSHFMRAKVLAREDPQRHAHHRSWASSAGTVRRQRQRSPWSDKGGIVLEAVKGWPVAGGVAVDSDHRVPARCG